jgi:hypothetical protein
MTHPYLRATLRWLPRRRAREGRTESGYSLIEATISLLLLGLLLATVPIVVQTMFSNQSYINNTYLNLDQLLPVSTSFQELIRSAVAPGPTATGANPTPAFGSYNSSGAQSTTLPTLSNTSATFYSNIGDSTTGPAEIVAFLTNTCAMTTGPSPTPYCTGSFKVDIAHANPGTCPGVTSGTACTWGTLQPRFIVSNVTNVCPSTTSSIACTQPLFTYTLQGYPVDPSLCLPLPATDPTGCVQYPQGGGPGGSPSFTTCTSGANNCYALDIQDVGIDLKVNATGSNPTQADQQTVVYELSENSATYSPDVG